MSESEANRLMEEGEKQLTKFAPFTSGEEKREKARERFLKAATQYKASSNFLAAAMAYKRSADMSEKSKIEIDVADDLMNAGQMYMKAGSADMASELLGRVVDIYDKSGKYSLASKVCVQLGELGGSQSDQWFERAITYLRNEGSRVTANDIVIKMINKSVNDGEYEKARQGYERIANEYLEENLTRAAARKYFFMSLLCQVAMLSKTNLMEQLECLRGKFEEFQERDPQLNAYTREHMLIAAIIDAMENDDVDSYTEAVCDYDNICPMDGPKQKMLMLGKRVLLGASPAKGNSSPPPSSTGKKPAANDEPDDEDDYR